LWGEKSNLSKNFSQLSDQSPFSIVLTTFPSPQRTRSLLIRIIIQFNVISFELFRFPQPEQLHLHTIGTEVEIKKIIKSFVRCLSKKFKQNENAEREHYGEIKLFPFLFLLFPARRKKNIKQK
jgi:hypothetical protein